MEAFAQLFEGLRPKVFAVAFRLVGEDSADDVVMETFLKAWQALPRFRGRASLTTWLYRIAYNCGLDFIRKEQRRRKHVVSDDALPDDRTARRAPERDRPDRVAARGDSAGVVREALARLTPEHRATLLMRFSDGLSYAEIAAATGVSIGTVMSRLYYGKRRLRAWIEEY